MALFVLIAKRPADENRTTFFFDDEGQFKRAVQLAAEVDPYLIYSNDYITDASEFERWLKGQG